MKRPLRLLSALLALCVLAAAFPPVGRAEGGAEYTLTDGQDLFSFLQDNDVESGAVIRCSGLISVAAQQNASNDPWVIDKDITIEGGKLSIYRGGILLGANVTFKDTELTFTSPIRNAFIANGYALTLDGVTASINGYTFNVFCGTLLPNSDENYSVPSCGASNTVIIRGKTNLQGCPSGSANTNVVGSGNIYVGSLAMGALNPDDDSAGKSNSFSADPTIQIEDHADPGGGVLPLGWIYAGGAQQRNLYGEDAKKPMLPDPDKYKVSGSVTVCGEKILNVNGAGSLATNVIYQGNESQATRTFENISSLSVERGNLALTGESWMRNDGTLSVASGAQLDLKGFGSQNFNIGSFDSQGYLLLNEDQTWYISGAVKGSTTVVIDYMRPYGNGYVSNGTPRAEHVYIQAQSSQDGNFTLLPSSSDLNMTLERDDSGDWTAKAGEAGGDTIIVESFGFPQPSVTEPSKTEEITIPLDATFVKNGVSFPYLDFIPLDIEVNGISSTRQENDGVYVYTWSDVSSGAQLTLEINEDRLTIYDYTNTQIPDGVYRIELKIPLEHTAAGTILTASVTLTVGGGTPDPGSVYIDVPRAKTGLFWTGEVQTGVDEGNGYTLTGHTGKDVGSYEAVATLEEGYRWTGGSAENQTIPWRIEKAPGLPPPQNLAGIAPSSAQTADGRITGTTTEMEYAQDADFKDAKQCGEPETPNLAAGKYYVRYAETDTRKPGASTAITVPAPGAAAVEGISIKTPAAKTEYQTGEALDLTGLTIEVSYSGGRKETIPVTADMVFGFDSSQAAQSQELTILHEGCSAKFTIKITAAQQAGEYRLTVDNTGSGGTAPGTYPYAEGAAVTVQAGSKSGYTFAAWEATGVELANRNVPDVSFSMPKNDVTLHAIWRENDTPPSGHVHAWSTAWSSGATHHWHDCSAPGCPIAQNSQKSGYAPHTAGEWVVDRPASSSQDGLRHRSCTVCGYETARETIPATGGGGSSGGGSSSGSSSGGGSSSGSSSGGSSGGTVSVKNPDGSTTSTSTNSSTGTVTETTRRPDGSKLVVETKKDGTVTSTETAKDGSTVKTVDRPGGVRETAVNHASGLTASIREDSGGAQADVRLPAKTVRDSQSSGAAVALPIPALSGANASVTLRTGSVRPLRVEIPVRGNESTTVAYLVNGDGDETMIKTAVLSEGRMTLSVPGGVTVRLRDNGRDFYDAQGHWAEDAIGFVTARELFSGTTASAFSPDRPMTRAMLMTVLARLDGTDAAGGAAYEKGAAWAVARGVSDGRNPEGLVTREQFVTMLHRYAGSPAAGSRTIRFSDEEAVGAYAREAVRWAVGSGIISGYGDGSFAPGGQATRAQAAAMLERYVRYLTPTSN